MRRLSLLIALMLVIPVANAFEGRLAVGLAVDVERIPEPVAVNGVPMILIRVAGADVPQLAQRIEAQWRGQGSEVKAMQQGQWTLRSRMQGQRSEVVQWRAGGATAELLWSSLDARSTLLAATVADLTLPAGCSWGRSVSGASGPHRYLQRSARCALTMRELSRQLQHSLPLQGWTLRSASETGLLLERPGSEGQIALSVQAGVRGTWLTWLRVDNSS